MQKILTEPLNNLTGWQRQVRQAIEYSLSVMHDKFHLLGFRSEPNINDVWIEQDVNGYENRVFVAEVLILVFSVSFIEPEPIYLASLRFKTEELSEFSKKSLEDSSERLKEYMENPPKTPILPVNEPTAYLLKATIKFGNNIIRMM